MKKIALVLMMVGSLSGADWYVSTTGGGDGSIGNPWSMQTALNHPASVQPGDTIHVRGGTYTGSYTNYLVGTALSPITVRAYQSESVVLTRSIYYDTNTAFVTVRGLHFKTDITSRFASDNYYPSCLVLYGTGHKVIHNIFTNCSHPSIGSWNIEDGEIYGNIIRYTGVLDDQSPGYSRSNPWVRGSGVYGQNTDPVNPTNLESNIWYKNFTTGINFYGEGGAVKGLNVDNEISFYNSGQDFWIGVTAAGNFQNVTVDNSYSYKNPNEGYIQPGNGCAIQFGVGGDQPGPGSLTNSYLVGSECGSTPIVFMRSIDQLTITGNTIVAPKHLAGDRVPSDNNHTSTTWNNNSYYGGWVVQGPTFFPWWRYISGAEDWQDWTEWKADTGFDAASTYSTSLPTTNQTFILPADRYIAKRAHFVVYNWQNLTSVSINPSAYLSNGDTYQIWDVECYTECSPVASGTYSGAAISVPMTGTAQDTIMGSAAQLAFVNPRLQDHTPQTFGVFVLQGAAASGPTLEITTTSLPDGTENIAYSQTVSATGGTPPYTFDVSAGSVPTGLTLNSDGTITGTPTTAGTYNFTARVTDAVLATDTQALSIVIAAQSSAMGPVSILKITPQQATIKYTALSSNDCVVKVSKTSNFLELIPDVDPVLFPGRQYDSREGSYRLGVDRVFVIGERIAKKASDGLYYSLSLQAYTTYFVKVTCDANDANISFTAMTIPFGQLYNDPIPPDPDNPGVTAWPSLDWEPTNDPTYTNSKKMVTDPQTGIGIRVISVPKHATSFTRSIGYTVGSSWTTPDNVKTDDANSASFTGTGSGSQPWMRAIAVDSTTSYSENWSTLYNYHQPLHVKFLLKGSVTGGSGGDDNCVECCLTWGGAACESKIVTVDLTTCGGGGCTVGNDVPGMGYWKDPADPLKVFQRKTRYIGRTGTADYNATTKVVTWKTGKYFDPEWAVGGYFQLFDGGAYVPFEIASVDNYKQLTLVSGPAGDLTDVNFIGNNFGVLCRKKTATTNTVNLQYIQFTYPSQHGSASYFGGAPNTCHPTKVQQTSTGRWGYRCMLGHDPAQFYWIDPDSGDATFIGDAVGTWAGRTGLSCSQNVSGFFSTDPNKYYCFVNAAATGTDNHDLEVTINSNNDDVAASTSIQTASTNVDRGSTDTRVENFMLTDPSGPPFLAWWNCIPRAQGNNDYFTTMCGSQDLVSATGVIEASTGNVIAAVSWHGRYPMRYCTMHGASVYRDSVGPFSMMSVQTMSLSYPGSTSCGAGPLVTEATATIPATAVDACAPNTFGTTGQGCTNITVSGEPYDPSPCSITGYSENSNRGSAGPYGAFQDAQPGDMFRVGTGTSPGTNMEYMQLLEKNGSNWNMLRGVNTFAGTAGNVVLQHTGTPGPTLMGLCPNYALGTGTWSWNFLTDPHGLSIGTYAANHQATNGTLRKTAVSNYGVGYEVYDNNVAKNLTAFGDPTKYESATNDTPTFAGKEGRFGAEAHSNWGSSAPLGTNELVIQDNRPGTYSPGASEPLFTNVTGNLYSALYDGINDLYRKFLPTEAFCGEKPLLDVSGPQPGTTLLTGGASDAWKYCVVENDGECVAGSVKATANLYINCPNLTRTRCAPIGDGSNEYEAGFNYLNDPCVYPSSPIMDNVLQIKFGSNPKRDVRGWRVRLLGKHLSRRRMRNVYANAHVTPDGQWALVHTKFAPGEKSTYLGLKIPPLGPERRSGHTFDRATIGVGPMSGADNVVVGFGYRENGLVSNRYCTTRKEECIADVASYTDTTPFKFASETLTGVSCATGCKVDIPVIPGRIVYPAIKYRSGSTVLNTVVLPPM